MVSSGLEVEPASAVAPSASASAAASDVGVDVVVVGVGEQSLGLQEVRQGQRGSRVVCSASGVNCDCYFRYAYPRGAVLQPAPR